MLVYLARPIDQTDPTSPVAAVARRMYDEIHVELLKQGISSFNPARAYSLANRGLPTPRHLRLIDSINRHAIFNSDGVVAILPPGVATLGVPVEIELALSLNRPVLIVTTAGLASQSVQIANWMDRGAQVRTVRPEDRGALRFSVAEALSSLPDPTQLVLPDSAPSLLVKRGEGSSPLSRAYHGDAGLDLSVAGGHDVRPFEYTMLPTGIKAAIPDGYWGMITGRSSASLKHRIEVKQAVIDSGYRGELMIGMTWKPEPRSGYPDKLRVPPGMRLAQYVLLPVFGGRVTEVDELPGSERGERGYGSSGGHGGEPASSAP